MPSDQVAQAVGFIPASECKGIKCGFESERSNERQPLREPFNDFKLFDKILDPFPILCGIPDRPR